VTVPPPLEACCAVLYGDPLVELVAGESLHPGGLEVSRRLLAAARLAARKHVLDAGCGLGATARLAEREFGLSVDACDVSADAIRRATTLAQDAGASVRFAEASLLELPYSEGAFAAVIAECVLSTTSRAEALRELRRVTASDGMLLVSDVTSIEQVVAPEPLASVLCLTQAWRPGELEDEVGAAGFVVERSWDEASAVSDLIDRLETRTSLLATVLRDAGRSGGVSPALRDLFGHQQDGRNLSTVLAETRRLLHEGQIGYTALVARARSG